MQSYYFLIRGRGRFAHRKREGSVITEVEIERMWSQGSQKYWQPPEVGGARNRFSSWASWESVVFVSPWFPPSDTDFRLSKCENKFLLFWDTRFVIICCSSLRKLIQLTLEQQGFEPHRSTYMEIFFSINTRIILQMYFLCSFFP